MAQRIREQSIAVADATDGWEDYFTELKNNKQGYIVDLIKNTDDLSKLTGEDLINANKKARESAIAHNNALKQQTLGAKAATAATKALSVALNMAAMWAITEAIGFAVTKINEFVNAEKIARESAKEFSGSISDSISKIGDNSKKIKELNSEHQELSKHVTATGINIDLSSEKYDRYKQIVAEISEIMPDLTTYFNEQGEKIGFVKGQLADANKEYEKYIQNDAVKDLSDGDKIQDTLDAFNSNNDKGMWATVWNSFKARWGFVDEDSLENSKILQGLENMYNAVAAHFS